MFMLRTPIPWCKCNKSRFLSTAPPRPFKFHIGASFAGKSDSLRQSALGKDAEGFPKDSPIGIWRDSLLKQKKSVASTSAGEDFFFVQEAGLATP